MARVEPLAKIAITLDRELLEKLDFLIRAQIFKNRSQAIQEAVAMKVKQLERQEFEQACLKANKAEEQAWAELGWNEDSAAWPEY